MVLKATPGCIAMLALHTAMGFGQGEGFNGEPIVLHQGMLAQRWLGTSWRRFIQYAALVAIPLHKKRHHRSAHSPPTTKRRSA